MREAKLRKAAVAALSAMFVLCLCLYAAVTPRHAIAAAGETSLAITGADNSQTQYGFFIVYLNTDYPEKIVQVGASSVIRAGGDSGKNLKVTVKEGSGEAKEYEIKNYYAMLANVESQETGQLVMRFPNTAENEALGNFYADDFPAIALGNRYEITFAKDQIMGVFKVASTFTVVIDEQGAVSVRLVYDANLAEMRDAEIQNPTGVEGLTADWTEYPDNRNNVFAGNTGATKLLATGDMNNNYVCGVAFDPVKAADYATAEIRLLVDNATGYAIFPAGTTDFADGNAAFRTDAYGAGIVRIPTSALADGKGEVGQILVKRLSGSDVGQTFIDYVAFDNQPVPVPEIGADGSVTLDGDGQSVYMIGKQTNGASLDYATQAGIHDDTFAELFGGDGSTKVLETGNVWESTALGLGFSGQEYTSAEFDYVEISFAVGNPTDNPMTVHVFKSGESDLALERAVATVRVPAQINYVTKITLDTEAVADADGAVKNLTFRKSYAESDPDAGSQFFIDYVKFGKYASLTFGEGGETRKIAPMGEIGVLPALPAASDALHETYWTVDGREITAQTAFVWTENKTAVAAEREKLFTITFKVAGEPVKTAKYAPSGNVLRPAIPAKNGYTAAWEPFDLTKGGDLTVNAVYTPIVYTITLMVDGELFDTVEFTVEDASISLPALPWKDGYRMIGWDLGKFPSGNVTVNALYEKL